MAQAHGGRAGGPQTRPVDRLRHRLQAVSWWRGMMHLYPGGLVGIPMAAAILGVSRQRVRVLIDEGKLPAVKAFHNRAQRFDLIPVDALLGVGTPAETGRPVLYTREHPIGRRIGPLHNPWRETVENPPRQ